jgi:Sec-independent protein translocase protein TatA
MMMMRLKVVLMLLMILSCTYSYIPSNNNKINKFNRYGNSISIVRSKVISSRSQPLYLDFFGLGPSEFVIIIGVSVLLFGPDRIKEQLRSSGVKGEFVSSGWQADRQERIENLEKRAYQIRKARLFSRVAKENEDEEDK